MFHFLYRFADAARHRARIRQWNAGQASGRRGEDLAHRFLQQQGFTVVARNYRVRSGSGEIDIVAWHRDILVFIEVKSRRTDEFGTPDRAVDREKRLSLIRSAGEYVRRAGVAWERVRFDIVNVVFSDPPAIDRIEDAFHPSATV